LKPITAEDDLSAAVQKQGFVLRSKNKNLNVAGLVVLYNPGSDVVSNILTYQKYLDVLYIVDNSEKDIPSFDLSGLEKTGQVRYIRNGGNLGIAAALNIGANIAAEDGYEWLLTMDQDSFASSGMMNTLFDFILKNKQNRIGIASAYHAVKYGKEPSKNKCDYVIETMTSGNLVNLEAYKSVGGFLDELFIDSVDHEFCLKLNRAGYKVAVVNDACLIHSLGDRKRKKFIRVKNLFKKNEPLVSLRTYNNHSAMRKYYIVRNRLLVSAIYRKDFPEYRKKMVWSILNEFINVIFLENEKILKLRMMFSGYVDYKFRRLGKKGIPSKTKRL
jgi:rhamnosyltransferase